MVADWTPPLGIALRCGGPGLASPFKCDLPPGAKWGVSPQEGNGGIDCVKPLPNVCFHIDPLGLGFHAAENGQPGMALVSALTLDRTKPMSVRMVVRVDSLNCDSGVAYVGPVLYGGGVDDGDPTGRYRALYISCFAGDLKVRLCLYSPTYATPIWDFDFVDGQPHELGLDWYPGDHVDYWLDGAIVFTEGLSFGHDPLDVPTDPHPAIWMGGARGSIGRFDVYAGP